MNLHSFFCAHEQCDHTSGTKQIFIFVDIQYSGPSLAVGDIAPHQPQLCALLVALDPFSMG
jgi:hypothetical protein